MTTEYSIGKLTRTRADGSKYWSFCILWRNGESKRQRYSLGTTDRVEADALARKVWASLRGPTELETVGQVVEAYLASLAGRKDEYRKRSRWNVVRGYWSKLRLSAVDEQVSRTYVAESRKAINTIRNELTLVRSALNWAASRKLIAEAPTIALPTAPESKVGHLTKAQFRKFLTGCATPHVRLFAMLAVTTGGRKTALLEARWDQVDFDRAMFALNAEGRAQTHKRRATVPLNEVIMPALREAKAGALTEYIVEYHGDRVRDIKKGVAAAARRSKVACHPHMFRHSAAVWMAEDRVPMSEIASFLGHTDINVTIRVYARYHPDYLREAARSLTW